MDDVSARAKLDSPIWCMLKQYWKSPLRCPQCKKYAECTSITDEVVGAFHKSGYYRLERLGFSRIRSKGMILGRKSDGVIEDLGVSSWDELTDTHLYTYVEFLQVSKVMVPRVRLVLKDKDDRPKTAANTSAEPKEAPQKVRRRKSQ